MCVNLEISKRTANFARKTAVKGKPDASIVKRIKRRAIRGFCALISIKSTKFFEIIFVLKSFRFAKRIMKTKKFNKYKLEKSKKTPIKTGFGVQKGIERNVIL